MKKYYRCPWCGKKTLRTADRTMSYFLTFMPLTKKKNKYIRRCNACTQLLTVRKDTLSKGKSILLKISTLITSICFVLFLAKLVLDLILDIVKHTIGIRIIVFTPFLFAIIFMAGVIITDRIAAKNMPIARGDEKKKPVLIPCQWTFSSNKNISLSDNTVFLVDFYDIRLDEINKSAQDNSFASLGGVPVSIELPDSNGHYSMGFLNPEAVRLNSLKEGMSFRIIDDDTVAVGTLVSRIEE